MTREVFGSAGGIGGNFAGAGGAAGTSGNTVTGATKLSGVVPGVFGVGLTLSRGFGNAGGIVFGFGSALRGSTFDA